MNFKSWLVQNYAGENSPLGDLTSDIQEDETWPKNDSKKACIKHLKNMGAIQAAINTFEKAWDLYSKQKENSA